MGYISYDSFFLPMILYLLRSKNFIEDMICCVKVSAEKFSNLLTKLLVIIPHE